MTQATMSASDVQIEPHYAMLDADTSFTHGAGQPLTTNPHILGYVQEQVALTRPASVYWLDGTRVERDALTQRAVSDGVLIPLNQTLRPGCYLHRSNPNDVARSEHLTFICSEDPRDCGPTSQWLHPSEAYTRMNALFEGSMQGKTMYVIPYVMGPLNSPFSMVGLQVTDSIYVALNMLIMTRAGKVALDQLGPTSEDFCRGLHAVAECDPDRRFVMHFPKDNVILSYGSGYGGNALLGKKCLALRMASHAGWRDGWMAEHMLILGAESPDGRVSHVAAAFPSACGKTNFAMLQPPASFGGWKITTVGDDIAWLRPNPADGRLYAVNPEAGYFGVAPGTSAASNPHAFAMVASHTIFTNVAMTPEGDVWWEGMTEQAPDQLIDWLGQPWNRATATTPAAHPNSRFTVSMWRNPTASPMADSPTGVPIDALVFGGRRADTVPLVLQAFDWSHGAMLGATLGSETTAASTGQTGILRRDPMAMRPFLGYHLAAYWSHWLAMRGRLTNPPAVFLVNWFRRAARDPAAPGYLDAARAGRFIWPGFGDNMRVLEWIVARTRGETGAAESLVGYVPRAGDINLAGLPGAADAADAERILNAASHICLDDWLAETRAMRAYFDEIDAHRSCPALGETEPQPELHLVPATFRLTVDLLESKIQACRPGAADGPAAATPGPRPVPSAVKAAKLADLAATSGATSPKATSFF
ncbi:phosphoenolpyruvate carboxykinase (GTP) [Fonticula alba]|uniref:phosphoenolpyruvate carboxykinase (GTP) n=1 Tax=Fonticula alba TaxID=691883 RepID=A0A058Z5B6_FONAL|nr:phosphoenolpyruvate carboxykinase (GTP) [Fonticula alba]KCV69321.1 phosphoenolpyruvate carboxykinase (GTP) [Fonticula alba]|eukprot:XP_009495886.1 phosphoenolpyruvate carboxykinase (GTP) [Fonticula alba]